MKKYVIIPADINQLKFSDLKNRVDTDKALAWNNKDKNGDNIFTYNIGDMVFIYYKNLTDGTKRILFGGIIKELEHEFIATDGYKTKGILIKDLRVLNLTDKEKFNLKRIESIGIKGTSLQRPRKLCDEDTLSKNMEVSKFVKELKDSYDNHEYKIKDVINYFNKETLCVCCKLLKFTNNKALSRTFKKTNGFMYYEVHHLLEQNLYRKDENWFKEHNYFKVEDLKHINDDFNRINLCPVCHREFHYGNFDYNFNSDIKSKKDLILAIWKQNNYEEHLKKDLEKNREEINKIKDYLLSQYL